MASEVAGRGRQGVAGAGQPAFSPGRISSSLADIGPGELTEDEFWRVKDVLEGLGEEAGRALEAMDTPVREAAGRWLDDVRAAIGQVTEIEDYLQGGNPEDAIRPERQRELVRGLLQSRARFAALWLPLAADDRVLAAIFADGRGLLDELAAAFPPGHPEHGLLVRLVGRRFRGGAVEGVG